MAPQFSPAELDFMQQQAQDNKSPVQIHTALCKQRARKKLAEPDLTTVRRALKGKTFKRSRTETRGKKPKLTPQAVEKLNKARLQLQTKAKAEYEVHWKDIIKAARVPKIDPTTAARRVQAAGHDVKWRQPRQKPIRDDSTLQERTEVCSRLRRYPVKYFSDTLDLIMDNKSFEIPTYAKAKKYAKMRKVRGHLRTRGEGLKDGYTKPGKKHRVNPGGKAMVCAGIINCKVKVWHYLPRGRWNGQLAADTYEGPIYRALLRNRGEKRKYKVLEDNDPTGYKSHKAVAAKANLGVEAMTFPRYSPDLNPLDYFLWHEVEERMAKNSPGGRESVADYKAQRSSVCCRLFVPAVCRLFPLVFAVAAFRV